MAKVSLNFLEKGKDIIIKGSKIGDDNHSIIISSPNLGARADIIMTMNKHELLNTAMFLLRLANATRKHTVFYAEK